MAEADSARLWQKFRLDWNYNSNRIEGNTLTHGETKALLEEGIKPLKMRKDILQMQSHDKAINVLKELAASDRPLTEADIRELHKTALGENYWNEAITIDGTITRREIEIGTYKQKPNMVLKQDGTEHVYALPNEAPARMAELVKRLRTYLKKPDVSLHDYLAELHQDFIETHPFDDGNGRVVRLLINYVCLHMGWPPVIIKSEKRSEYIATLESWNNGKKEPLRQLMKQELIWSLNISNKAARGEDIEEEGDLDKRISLAASGAIASGDKFEFAKEKISHICEVYFIPTIEKSVERFNKFGIHYDETHGANFYEHIQAQLESKKSNIQTGICHIEQKTGSNLQDYYLNFHGDFGRKSYQLYAHIFYASASFDKKIKFSETLYSAEFNAEALRMFKKQIGEAMLEGFEGLLENRTAFYN